RRRRRLPARPGRGPGPGGPLGQHPAGGRRERRVRRRRVPVPAARGAPGRQGAPGGGAPPGGGTAPAGGPRRPAGVRLRVHQAAHPGVDERGSRAAAGDPAVGGARRARAAHRARRPGDHPAHAGCRPRPRGPGRPVGARPPDRPVRALRATGPADLRRRKLTGPARSPAGDRAAAPARCHRSPDPRPTAPRWVRTGATMMPGAARDSGSGAAAPDPGTSLRPVTPDPRSAGGTNTSGMGASGPGTGPVAGAADTRVVIDVVVEAGLEGAELDQPPPDAERLVADAVALARAGRPDGADLAPPVGRYWRLTGDQEMVGRAPGELA